MVTVLLVGTDEPLLEGLAQTLAAAGHPAMVATTVGEAFSLAASDPPLVCVVDRAVALEHSEVAHLNLKPGGALIVYHTIGAQPTPLPSPLQRLTLADLALPLERQRLVALVASLASRARRVGRDLPRDTRGHQST